MVFISLDKKVSIILRTSNGCNLALSSSTNSVPSLSKTSFIDGYSAKISRVPHYIFKFVVLTDICCQPDMLKIELALGKNILSVKIKYYFYSFKTKWKYPPNPLKHRV